MTESTGEISSGCVLVTGAGSGIGAATARILAATGRPVALAGRRAEPLSALSDTIIAAGGRSIAVPCDVRDPAEVLAAAEAAAESFQYIDVFVGAAGVMPVGPIDTADPGDWKQMLEVNVLGVLHGIHSVLPGMLARGNGHIVLVGSIAGRALFPGATVYCASKSAVQVIAEGLRSELVRRRRDDGNRIRVTLVSPGAVNTDLPTTIADPEARASTEAWYAGMDGILQPEDVAEAIRWSVQAPEHVSVNEVVVRPTSMAR